MALEWLLKGNVTQLVLVLLSKDTRTPLERWVFNVDLIRASDDKIQPYVLQDTLYLLLTIAM